MQIPKGSNQKVLKTTQSRSPVVTKWCVPIFLIVVPRGEKGMAPGGGGGVETIREKKPFHQGVITAQSNQVGRKNLIEIMNQGLGSPVCRLTTCWFCSNITRRSRVIVCWFVCFSVDKIVT